ncbi:MAG: CNNM domain-containing protein, partial [Ignavibacteria bacterium]|nr:CNNM domain-containing protein [Ignavibacteria bacterium]
MNALYIEGFGILLLILLVGFFSASEVAVLSTRKSRMKELAEGGNRNAILVLFFQNNPEQFLATVHVGIVFSLIFA